MDLSDSFHSKASINCSLFVGKVELKNSRKIENVAYFVKFGLKGKIKLSMPWFITLNYPKSKDSFVI